LSNLAKKHLFVSTKSRCLFNILRFSPAYAEYLFAGVASVGALLAVGLTGRCIQRDEQRRRAANERWQRQVARWQQAWYCHRCHVAFVAGSAEAVVPEQFGRLFRT
jgi:hypothetical protein